MRLAIFAFAAGVLVLQWLPALPSAPQRHIVTIVTALLILSAVIALWRGWLRRRSLRLTVLVALAFHCGFIWSAWHAAWRLDDALPAALEQRDIEVTGVIAGLPRRMDGAVRFIFEVETAQEEEREVSVPERIQLSWYPPRNHVEDTVPSLKPGQRWRLTVRLKRPHGFVNPHAFDYEAWLLERNIRATGYQYDKERQEWLKRLSDHLESLVA